MQTFPSWFTSLSHVIIFLCGPGGPVSPLRPLSPMSPFAPFSPVGPCGPGSLRSPFGPASPCSPFRSSFPCTTGGPYGPVEVHLPLPHPCSLGSQHLPSFFCCLVHLFVPCLLVFPLLFSHQYGPRGPSVTFGPRGSLCPVRPCTPGGPVSPGSPLGPGLSVHLV